MKTNQAKEAQATRALILLRGKVCARAERGLKLPENYERINLAMDLDSLPDLDLDRLLGFPAFDFAHDIHGIMRHMDRSSYPGSLRDCFEPRCGRVAKSGARKARAAIALAEDGGAS